MKNQWFVFIFTTFMLLATLPLSAAEEKPPRSLDPRLKIELFAEHPDIVTPTGIDVDHRGRVWAIESNTHFPPEGYDRHPTDRVLVFQDTNGDGRADKKTVFTDGLTHTMSVAVRPVWLDPVVIDKKNKPAALQVYLATRGAIWLYEDTDGDLKADRKTRLVHLDTPGNYPHNGLAGFAFDALGWMHFGFGENLGADYKITGSDGATLKGGSEGGNIYRCRPDGTKLKKWATGFWNPHANCVDAFGRLFSVDNDPDSRPPCRLLHIIEGGDYGFRFRNGRKGLHPFTAWNGEIPGTLPMVAGTGEAPSGIVAYESDGLPKDYIGNLLVPSWGDHRIDRFRLKAKGTSFESIPETIIQGGENFRPVGIATAPDGSLFITDWVLRDYKLHQKGRIWRISAVKEPQRKIIDAATITEKTSEAKLIELVGSARLDVRRRAARMLVDHDKKSGKQDNLNRDGLFANKSQREFHEWMRARYRSKILADSEKKKPLSPAMIAKMPAIMRQLIQRSDDPFVRTRLINDWVGYLDTSTKYLQHKFLDTTSNDSLKVAAATQQRRMQIAILLIARATHPKDSGIPLLGLKSKEATLRRLAAQWIAEEKLIKLRPQVAALLDNENTNTDLFLATIAALEMLDGVDPKNFDKTPAAKYVLPILKDEQRPATVRALALRLVSPDDPALDAELYRKLLASDSRKLQLETIRTLQHSPLKEASQLLSSVAANDKLGSQLRAEAIAGLTPDDATLPVLLKTLHTDDSTLVVESLRSLRPKAENPFVGKVFEALSNQPIGKKRIVRDQIALALKSGGGFQADRLDNKTLAGGDAQAGRRIFFHRNSAGCYKCHTVDGRGGRIGPDLSLIARTMDRKKLAESILDPSREISPQFTNWSFVMESGRLHSGMLLGDITRDRIQHIGTADGKVIQLRADEIEIRQPQTKSVMPDRLAEQLTFDELRNLLAFLATLK